MPMKRTLTILLAMLLCLPMSGCGIVPSNSELSSQTDSAEVLRYDLTKIDREIEALQDIWTTSGNDAQVQAHIDTLIGMLDAVTEQNYYTEMAYYANWEDEVLQTAYDQTTEDYYVAYEMLCWTFTQGAEKSVYPALFEPYTDESWKSYYLAYSLSRIQAMARQDSASYDEILDSYYDVAYDEETPAADANADCAQLYLDTLATYDTSHALYDYYNRDYTVEQAAAAYAEIVEQLVPIFTALEAQLESDARYERLFTEGYGYVEPFDTLQTYAPKLSADIGASVTALLDENRYVTATGDACYDGCYTVMLPTEQSAMIYLYQAKDYYDLTSLVHEFGHFHADRKDSTSVYFQINNADVAEVQSQGLEMLFTQYYDEIYGQDAAFFEQLALYNLLHSIVTGFGIGQFEAQVMAMENPSAEAVLALFEDIDEACHMNMELYSITHLFQQPGYYISYGVSALAALELYTVMQSDAAQALAMYEDIVQCSSFTVEYPLCKALDTCGFADIFAADTIAQMAQQLTVHGIA